MHCREKEEGEGSQRQEEVVQLEVEGEERGE